MTITTELLSAMKAHIQFIAYIKLFDYLEAKISDTIG